MKTRQLIIIGIVLASVVLVSSAYVISVQSRCESLLGDTHYPRPLTFWNCLDYLQMVDHPPPKSSAMELDPNPHPEPNTIIIYDVTENGKTRLSIAPHTLVMNLTDGNIVRFVNDGSTPVNVFDKSKGIWRFDDVKPSSQRVLTINSTGFYEVLVQNSREGESGRIVVLDNDVNSLSVSDRIKMGKAIISGNFREYPELVSVGAGSGEIGVHVTINKKELELHEDAKSYYHEKFSKIIPFDVPIIIEFGEPIKPE